MTCFVCSLIFIIRVEFSLQQLLICLFAYILQQTFLFANVQGCKYQPDKDRLTQDHGHKTTCVGFETQVECGEFSTENYNFVYEFALISGSIPTCYNHCSKLYEIVVEIDTSLSVTSDDPDNREIQRELSKLQNDLHETANADECKFSLVTYSGVNSFTTVQFDVNNNFFKLLVIIQVK